MEKQVKEKMARIDAIAKSKNPKAIDDLTSIAMNLRADLKVRIRAVMAIGGFGLHAVSPLKEISAFDEGQVGKTATRILHALYEKQKKNEWRNDSKSLINNAISSFMVMNEDKLA